MLQRFAIVSLIAVVSACGSGGGNTADAGSEHPDYVFPDVVIDGAMVVPDASDARHDVAPVVDVVYFDSVSVPDVAVAVDAGATTCQDIADAYASAVHDAETCSVASDCSMSVCETLCCSCYVYVNASAASFAAIMVQKNLWEAMHCDEMTACPSIECAPASAAVCSSDGRCITLRGGSG